YVGYGGPRFYLALSPADPNPSSAFFAVNMSSVEAVQEIVPRARRVFTEQFPGARFRVTRLSMGGSESGIVEVEITGPDGEVLMAAAEQVERAFAEIPTIIRNEIDWGKRVLKIVLDVAQDRAREFGITSEDLSEVMEAYFSGTAYSTFREADEQIPIVLRAQDLNRDSIEDLANLSVGIDDQLISVDQVASFKPQLEYSEIRRENQIRQIVIYGKSSAHSAQALLAEIQPVLDGLDLGPEYAINIAGELEDSADTYGEIGGNLPIALGIMLAALVFQFNSMRRSLATFMTIPVIMIGAPFALMITGQPMSFFAVLGLMSLMGIIINNAIVLINQIDLDAEEMPIEDAIVSAAQKRATPIMLTSLTTVFGLVPLAMAGGSLFEPMATIMMGGLIVASPLTLLFVPSLCYTLMKREKRQGGAATAPVAEPAPAS
ncbi:MAG: efflux RND transporter permease subunit, partial [Pseudomonadota bacterium]